MGRWLVILSLALAQCPDIVAASPQSPGIPLPKPRPIRRDPSPPAVPALAVKAAVAAPLSPEPVAEPGDVESRESPAPSLADAPPVETPEPAVKSGKANGGCSGRRIISAYYWQGQRTASGERFDPQGMTAAHRTLPFGTHLTVSSPRTGKSVTVVVNDRGPFVSGVGLDLSLGAAQAIGMHGTEAVCIE
jgi:rare lipoprotein A